MCGIFGWIPTISFCKTPLPPIAKDLFTSLYTRGPNDCGYTLFDRKGQCIGNEKTGQQQAACLLGQTRLSVIDLSSAGHQPMFTSDKRYCITYNGEIYNYHELRKELQALGITFHTGTDTEVLLQSYVAWGKRCLDRLNGMYAFAIYDTFKNTLFCARDCFGIKPFFWYAGKSGFCFASEIPALLCFPDVPRIIDLRQVYEFLSWGHVEQGPQTMIQNIHRLQAAHLLEVDVADVQNATNEKECHNAICIKRYWKIPLPEAAKISFTDAAATVREIFLNNVHLQLCSDVPLGVALSGGIDSTAIACAVRHLEPDTDLHTFSFIADDPTLSEESWIDKSAKGCNAICHKVKPGSEDLLNDMDHMVLRIGEPFLTTSTYAQYTVMRLAKEHGITVLLEGQGADELFAGYTTYLEMRMITLSNKGNVEKAIEFLMAAAQWPGRHKIVVDLLAKYGLHAPVFKEPPINMQQVLRLSILSEAGVPLAYCTPTSGVYHCTDQMRATLAEHLTWNSVPRLMRHGDRNAMSFSIENRVPFCTRDMATFALSLPEEYLISSDGCSKYVLREALRGLVPDAILNRRDKIGFDAPGFPWLCHMLPWLIQNFIESDSIFIDTKAILQIWKDVIRGTHTFDWFYWRVISYLRWKKLLNLQEAL